MWLGLTVVGCGQQAGENTPPFIGAVNPDAGRSVPRDTQDAATPSANQAGTPAAASGGDKAPPPQDSAGAPADPAPTGDAQTGSAIAISPDDSLAVVVNRDVGSLSVLALGYDKEALTEPDERRQLMRSLVQYLLSIDESTAYSGLPGTGSSGGSLCPQSF
jgi:hypothetical protein